MKCLIHWTKTLPLHGTESLLSLSFSFFIASFYFYFPRPGQIKDARCRLPDSLKYIPSCPVCSLFFDPPDAIINLLQIHRINIRQHSWTPKIHGGRDCPPSPRYFTPRGHPQVRTSTLPSSLDSSNRFPHVNGTPSNSELLYQPQNIPILLQISKFYSILTSFESTGFLAVVERSLFNLL